MGWRDERREKKMCIWKMRVEFHEKNWWASCVDEAKKERFVEETSCMDEERKGRW